MKTIIYPEIDEGKIQVIPLNCVHAWYQVWELERFMMLECKACHSIQITEKEIDETLLA